MTEPQVSIVLPTFNGERYLDASIGSVVAQTLADWELIVVDDCSTDGSAAIAQRWAARDPRIRLVRHEQNKKLPAALNTGFAGARGPYMTWTSDDNLYRPHALERMLEYLRAHPDIDVVYTDYSFIDANGTEMHREPVGEPSELVEGNVVRASFLYKRAVHERLNGYDESLFLVEDYDFWLRASTAFRLQPLHEDLYLFRRHEGSLTEQRLEEIRRLAEHCLLAQLPRMGWLSRRDRAMVHARLARGAFARGESDAARRWWWRAVCSAPVATWRRSSARLIANAIVGLRLTDWISGLKAKLGGRSRPA
jgi:glycosyltransferase involved in cell wall biosynthesis